MSKPFGAQGIKVHTFNSAGVHTHKAGHSVRKAHGVVVRAHNPKRALSGADHKAMIANIRNGVHHLKIKNPLINHELRKTHEKTIKRLLHYKNNPGTYKGHVR